MGSRDLKKTSKFKSPQIPEVFLNFNEFDCDFLFVCYLCLADPSLNIILHRWNFSFNDVNYFSKIKKIFLIGNFLLFFQDNRITKYLYRSGISLGIMHYEIRVKLLKYKIGKNNLINFFPE
jgi:hypothetical protein